MNTAANVKTPAELGLVLCVGAVRWQVSANGVEARGILLKDASIYDS